MKMVKIYTTRRDWKCYLHENQARFKSGGSGLCSLNVICDKGVYYDSSHQEMKVDESLDERLKDVASIGKAYIYGSDSYHLEHPLKDTYPNAAIPTIKTFIMTDGSVYTYDLEPIKIVSNDSHDMLVEEIKRFSEGNLSGSIQITFTNGSLKSFESKSEINQWTKFLTSKS